MTTPVMSERDEEGPSVFFSDSMRRYDHIDNINHDLKFAHLQICDTQQRSLVNQGLGC